MACFKKKLYNALLQTMFAVLPMYVDGLAWPRLGTESVKREGRRREREADAAG